MGKQKVEMGVLKLFPTLVYQIDASELIEPSLKSLKDIKWTNKANDASKDKFILRSLKYISGQFDAKVNLCLETLGYELPMKMTTSWWTRTSPGGVIYRHKHTNCMWSAVFYPYENTSSIIFEKADQPQIDVGFKCTDPQFIPYGKAEIQIKKGTMLIFPSHMFHWTMENDTDKYRYSLAMNFMPHGKVYHGDSSYNYQ